MSSPQSWFHFWMLVLSLVQEIKEVDVANPEISESWFFHGATVFILAILRILNIRSKAELLGRNMSTWYRYSSSQRDSSQLQNSSSVSTVHVMLCLVNQLSKGLVVMLLPGPRLLSLQEVLCEPDNRDNLRPGINLLSLSL